MLYRAILKPILFTLSTERAHHLAMSAWSMVSRLPGVTRRPSRSSATQLAGVSFPNRVGLAAGFDKDGRYVDALLRMPFGHIEIGTVTPRAQPGNPRPRLFRLPADEALINRMGFNNEGMDALYDRLSLIKERHGTVIGVNIGKNKDTPNDEATSDYLMCYDRLHDLGDYFTINISSPNTPGLRDLQAREPLDDLLGTLVAARTARKSKKPFFLKVAPDLTASAMDQLIDIVIAHGIEGIIATNTTISRKGLSTPSIRIEEIGAGGLSGHPLHDRSVAWMSYLRAALPRPFVLIGVGGIQSSADAQRMLDAGADLVQIYTGFIYQGPQLVRDLDSL